MPNMLVFIVLFALMELILGILILSKEKRARMGLAGAALFGIGLLLLGLGAKRTDWAARIPNLVFEATILYSLFFNYDRTLIQTLHPKKDWTRTAVIGS